MQSIEQMSCKARQTTLFTFLAGRNTYKKYQHNNFLASKYNYVNKV